MPIPGPQTNFLGVTFVCDPNNFGRQLVINADGSINISGSITASLGAFNPKGVTTLAVSNVSSSVAFPTADTAVVLRNTGTVDAFFAIGGAGVTATTSSFIIKAGDIFGLDVSGNTFVAGITSASTTTFEIWTGTGLIATSQGGGSSGGGGNVNLTQVGGAAIAIGQAAMAASLPVVIASNQSAVTVAQATAANFNCTAVTTGGVTIAKDSSLTTINTTLGTPFQAGGSIGNTTFAATQASAAALNATVVGTGTFAVQATLQAGSAKFGQVAIDQTTPGSTNAVDVTNFPVTVDTNVGTAGASTLRIAFATGSTTIATQATAANLNATVVGTGTFAVQLTGATNNINNIAGTISLPTGASTAAKQPALGTAGTPSADVLTVQGATSMTPLAANPSDETPVLKNGLTNSASSVVSSVAAKLKAYYCYNPNATVAYVQIFDVATAGAVTVGTTVPKWSIGIPATSAANLANLNLSFANGIQVAATTTATGASAPGTALDCNFSYR